MNAGVKGAIWNMAVGRIVRGLLFPVLRLEALFIYTYMRPRPEMEHMPRSWPCDKSEQCMPMSWPSFFFFWLTSRRGTWEERWYLRGCSTHHCGWDTHVKRLRSRSRGTESVIIVFIMPALSCSVISPLGSFEVSTHGMDEVYHNSNGCNLSLRFFLKLSRY